MQGANLVLLATSMSLAVAMGLISVLLGLLAYHTWRSEKAAVMVAVLLVMLSVLMTVNGFWVYAISGPSDALGWAIGIQVVGGGAGWVIYFAAIEKHNKK
jgi:hypothetical protein